MTATPASGDWAHRRLPAIGWSVAFLVLSYVLASALGFAAAVVAAGSVQAVPAWFRLAGPEMLLIQGIAMLIAALLVTWFVGVRICKLDAAALRYEGGRRGFHGVAGGLILGALAAGTALLLSALLGGAEWVRDDGGIGAYASQIGKTLLVLAPAALAEEVVFRGVPLVLLAYAFGRAPALIALAVLFGLGHWLNPNATALGIANIMAAGLFLGLAFFAPGGIWTAFGAHLGWNAMLAALDTPVSGLPFRIPFIDYEAGGPAWLTGGAFGPEGGLTATAAIGCACVATVKWIRKDMA